MQKSLLTLFCALCALSFIPSSLMAEDYTVEPTTAIKAKSLPIYMQSGSTTSSSITQQIFWPSELLGEGDKLATAGNITHITFYYAAKDGTAYSTYTANACSRDIQIFLMESDVASYALQEQTVGASHPWLSKFLCNGDKKPGTRVYNGKLNTVEVNSNQGVKTVTIELDSPFPWDGESNIVMTVADVTKTAIGSNASDYLKFYITEVSPVNARFVYMHWTGSDAVDSWLADIDKYGESYGTPTDSATQVTKRKYVPKTTFTITPAAVVIPVPENLSTTSVTTTSARLLWDAVDGATGYNVQWGTNSGSLDHSASNVSNNYLDINELVDGTTYYFAVQTIKDDKTSSYSDAASFNTTAITITYKDMVFKKWNSTTALPSEAGNYYLNDDVVLSAQYTLPGNINLCLNGNDVYTDTYNVKVPTATSLAIYDNIGGGRIYGHYVADMTDGYGLISVENGGELVLGEGAVENLYGYYVDEEDPSQSEDPDASYAISVNNGGSFKLSGAPTLSAAKACIYLLTMFPRITIESGKPLTNLSAYSVDASGQTITSGWANMGDVDPNVHFVSKKSTHKGITLNEGEVKFVSLSDLDVSLNESSAENESKLTAELGNDVSLAITRSPLTNAQFNTICLPYSMDDDEMQLRFGVGYDLEEFVSSSLDGDELSLVFSQVTSLDAGKPYLLKPSINAPALSYLSVNIAVASPVDQTSDTYISFHGTFNPTELTGGNKNLLFLGAGNELFWPESTDYLKGFRAYFEVKGAAQKAAKRARIVKKEDSATGIDQITNDKSPMTNKIIKDNQLLILRDNKTYNVIGQMVK